MKNILVTFLLCFGLSLCSLAQSQVRPSLDWVVLYETDQVRFSSKYSDCNIPEQGLNAQYILLKLENKTQETLGVTWFNDLYYSGKCSNCDHQKNDLQRSFTLQPHEIVEGECGVGLNRGLRVFIKMLLLENHRVLEKLMVSDIKIEFVK